MADEILPGKMQRHLIHLPMIRTRDVTEVVHQHSRLYRCLRSFRLLPNARSVVEILASVIGGMNAFPLLHGEMPDQESHSFPPEPRVKTTLRPVFRCRTAAFCRVFFNR